MCILANPFFENVYSFDFKEEYTSGGGSQARGSGPLGRALLPEKPDQWPGQSAQHGAVYSPATAGDHGQVNNERERESKRKLYVAIGIKVKILPQKFIEIKRLYVRVRL